MSDLVSIFLQNLHGGGAERMMLNLAEGIASQGFAVDLVLARAEGALMTAVPAEVKLVDLAAKRTLSSVPALSRYLKNERPAALLSALTHVNVAALLANLLAGRHCRVIISERSTISQERREVTAPAIRAAFGLVPRLYRLADGIVAVSNSAAADLCQYANLPSERVCVIKNPVVTPRTRRLAGEPVLHEWYSSEGPPVVLGVGRLSPEKEFGTLIEAFAELRRRRPARLLILGEGEERPRLEALVRRLGVSSDVELHGFVENPHAYISRAAAVVLTSRWEGSPNVLVEAMACGTPVISTDCRSGPREILDGGRLGPLVPVGDSSRLAEEIGKTLSNPLPADQLIAGTSEFTVEESARQYLDVLLGREGRAA